jgi:hypothetical protein
MRTFTILPLAILVITAGAVRSQAPVASGDITATLQTMADSNKTLIDKQTKTLQALDALDQTAQEIKTFTKRS